MISLFSFKGRIGRLPYDYNPSRLRFPKLGCLVVLCYDPL